MGATTCWIGEISMPARSNIPFVCSEVVLHIDDYNGRLR